MAIAVLAISDLVRSWGDGPRTGAVHSTFATSFNVELDGHLLHIGSAEAPLSCFGATVEQAKMAELVRMVQVGDSVRLRQGSLFIYSRAGVSELALGAAPVRAMSVPRGNGAPEGSDAALCLTLGRINLPERIGLPWPERSSAAVIELARFSVACLRLHLGAAFTEAEARYDSAVRAMRGAVDYLLGRGLGLTPSGDDVLCGFGCALRFLYGSGTAADPFFQTVQKAVSGRTTAVSEAYLRAMVGGFANEDYLELVEVLTARDYDALPECVNHVLDMGHTSGADGLLGFGAAFCCLY